MRASRHYRRGHSSRPTHVINPRDSKLTYVNVSCEEDLNRTVSWEINLICKFKKIINHKLFNKLDIFLFLKGAPMLWTGFLRNRLIEYKAVEKKDRQRGIYLQRSIWDNSKTVLFAQVQINMYCTIISIPYFLSFL